MTPRALRIGIAGLLLQALACGGDDEATSSSSVSASGSSSSSGGGGGGSATGGSTAAAGGAGPCGALALCGGDCVDTATSVDHCGGCDVDCSAAAPSTAECVAGRCLAMLASTPGDAGAVAVGAGAVFWLNGIGGAIHRVPKAGGDPETAVSAAVTALAVDATSLYWAESQVILKGPHGGAPPLTLGSGPNSVSRITLDAANVYFLMHTVPKNGGLTIALGSPGDSFEVRDMATDATHVYWTKSTFDGIGQVKRAPLAGGPGQEIAWDQCGLDRVVVWGGEVFWTSTGTSTCPPGGLLKAPVAGGEWMNVAGGHLTFMTQDTSGSSVYAVSGGAIVRIPLTGGGPETVSAVAGVLGLAVDETSLYWTTAGNGVGKVWRLTPK